MSRPSEVDNEFVDLRSIARDENGIVIAWLLRVVLGIAISGVILFDAGSIVFNFFSLDGATDEVALEVVTRVSSGADVTPNLQCTRRSADSTCKAVYDVAREKGVRVVSAHFDQEGVFHVEAKRTADTLFVGRIDAIADWATATASAQADTN